MVGVKCRVLHVSDILRVATQIVDLYEHRSLFLKPNVTAERPVTREAGHR
jgi:hypothetical protein